MLETLNQDHTFVLKMIKADALQEKKKLRAFLNLPPNLGIGGERASKMKKYLDSFPEDLSDIRFAEIAETAGVKHMYDTYYRGLSHTSAHPNIQALTRHASYDENGDAKGFHYGPDASGEQLNRIVAYACAVFHCASRATITLFEAKNLLPVHDQLYQRYAQLANRDFPDYEQSSLEMYP